MKTLILAMTLIAAASAGQASVAQAQAVSAPAAACTTPSDSNLPPAWSGWISPETLAAAGDPAKSPDVSVSHAYDLTLLSVAQVMYPVAADKAPMVNSFGGLLSLKVTETGTYTVALDDKAWVDVVRDGKIVKSVSHNQGPACTTVHKAVDFTLEPGVYAIQLSNAPSASLKLLIIRK
ncbi:MAG: hypothetical protein QM647_10665 [Asticcacaulis sp.]|uniref:hypothetical protein n=1 Tax=Asticcacaulis sp. TaxID=1872648 RepID=UPI0039E49568